MTNKEAIKAIKCNYPPSSYSMLREALDISIELLEHEDKERWTSVSEDLPKEDGDYLCTIEWYGTSTKEWLIKNGYEIGRRLKLVHFLNSDKSFKECDEFCTYKVLAWKNQGLYKGE